MATRQAVRLARGFSCGEAGSHVSFFMLRTIGARPLYRVLNDHQMEMERRGVEYWLVKKTIKKRKLFLTWKLRNISRNMESLSYQQQRVCQV